jgi:pseudouridine-5'-phosphate glycosidase
MLKDRLRIAPDVALALAAGDPIVALESTLISHGLPYPANLEVAEASEAAVRGAGAVPATVAVRDGALLVGLAREDLLSLATAADVRKASRPTLAAALDGGGWAGTTVSATMLTAAAAGIPVFATGGIGGVHRGALGGPGFGAHPARPTLDISSDLEELARTPMAVVCAGPKSILDVPLTLEYLETRGVPVVTVGADDVPGFYARSSGVRSPLVADDVEVAARVAGTHLGLGLGSAILVCVPVPEPEALPIEVATEAIERALTEAGEAGLEGPAVTPWVLARLAELTDGASVRANTALIVNNAGVAGELAVALAGQGTRPR